jgi:hypothetical protein
MKLRQAFEIVPGDVVAFVGAGGKTSTLVTLGYELAEFVKTAKQQRKPLTRIRRAQICISL